MGKIKRKIPIIIAMTLFVISVALLIFPTVSNALYQTGNQVSIKEYENSIKTISETEKQKLLSDAKAYNDSLTETVSSADAFISNTYENIKPDYESVLDFGNGQMCAVEIPKINVNLPVYHGTSEAVLTKGAAHSANTSFPIGGIGTHSVISAHTAYPGKVFFDDLTELEKGDVFYINVLDEQLTYRVCDITIAEPDDTSKLQIAYDKDLVTLVTCYPYAVNSHRLLVTGERVNNIKTSTPEETEVQWNNFTTIIFICIGVALIIISIIIAATKILAKSKGRNKT